MRGTRERVPESSTNGSNAGVFVLDEEGAGGGRGAKEGQGGTRRDKEGMTGTREGVPESLPQTDQTQKYLFWTRREKEGEGGGQGVREEQGGIRRDKE
jgi:hypothetical protein